MVAMHQEERSSIGWQENFRLRILALMKKMSRVYQIEKLIIQKSWRACRPPFSGFESGYQDLLAIWHFIMWGMVCRQITQTGSKMQQKMEEAQAFIGGNFDILEVAVPFP